MDYCSVVSCYNLAPCSAHQAPTPSSSASLSSPTSLVSSAQPTTTSKKKDVDVVSEKLSSLTPLARTNRCFDLLAAAIEEQKEQSLIPLQNLLIVTKDLLTMHTERVCHEITKFVVMISQASPEPDALEALSTALLRHVDAYLSLHRVLLSNAGTTKRSICTKTVHNFIGSLQTVITQARERLLGEEKGSLPNTVVPILAVEKKNNSIELPSSNSSGVSLASHTGACLEACKALATVPLSNHSAVTKALLSLLSLVKDAKGEISEILEEAKNGDEDEEDDEEKLSPADLKRVKLACELSNLVYSTIRKLYEFSLKCTTTDENPAHVEWLEAQLASSTQLSTSLDDLGSTLYGPQDVAEVRTSMVTLSQELDRLLARFPTHPEFHLIFKLTFPAKELQEQDPEKIALACDAFITKCRAATEKVVRQLS